ncbi:unnamed protein product, partial [marine sediment metagenome]
MIKQAQSNILLLTKDKTTMELLSSVLDKSQN